MNMQELTKILDKHKLWLTGRTEGDKADLSGADLRGADLSWATLRVANLCRANLSGANLCWANLREANLSWVSLSKANLRGAALSGANLSGANLSGANLRRADLGGADLHEANLSKADLSGADLHEANLSRANLSGCVGLIDPTSWMKSNFKHSEKGYIVYKAFGQTTFSQDKFGKIRKGRIITEVCNPNRTDPCGCGINFATLQWIEEFYREDKVIIYKCLLSWEELLGVIVPYNTDGNARCSKLKLLDSVQAK